MKKVTFIILHYMAVDDTIECIESILKTVVYENYDLVIVDNNSPNKTGQIIQERYKENDKINVILSDQNLGFAKGNNLGYEYAKNILKSDFMVVLNNDTVIKQKDFIKLILETYKRTDFYLLGPDILSIKGEEYHQNPAKLTGLKKNEVKKLIKKLELSYKKCLIKYITHTDSIIKIFKNYIIKEKKKKNFYSEELYDVQLHGACIIFSEKYISKFSYAFFPETYMYMEEDILYYICKKNKFRIVYNPEIRIVHKEDVSTEKLTKSSIKKDIFILKHTRKSAKVLYKLME